MKYVIGKIKLGDNVYQNFPFIFPENFVHEEAAVVIRVLVEETYQRPCKIVSAGFADVEVECYGKSETLKLESQDTDSDLINAFSYLHGIQDGD